MDLVSGWCVPGEGGPTPRPDLRSIGSRISSGASPSGPANPVGSPPRLAARPTERVLDFFWTRGLVSETSRTDDRATPGGRVAGGWKAGTGRRLDPNRNEAATRPRPRTEYSRTPAGCIVAPRDLLLVRRPRRTQRRALLQGEGRLPCAVLPPADLFLAGMARGWPVENGSPLARDVRLALRRPARPQTTRRFATTWRV